MGRMNILAKKVDAGEGSMYYCRLSFLRSCFSSSYLLQVRDNSLGVENGDLWKLLASPASLCPSISSASSWLKAEKRDARDKGEKL